MSERKNNGIAVRAETQDARAALLRRNARSAVLRSTFAMAAVAALAFALAAPSRAQSQTTAQKSAAASATTPVGVAAGTTSPATQAPTPKTGVAPTAPAGQSAPRGQHEGVTIHGHWTIKVKNPDGGVAKQVEFENGLCLASGGGGEGFNGGLTGGDEVIAQLFSGQVVAGGWSIDLGAPTVPAGSSPGPYCNSAAITFQIQSANSQGCIPAFNTATYDCFSSLSAPTVNAASNGFFLTGQFLVPTGFATTTITAVGTQTSICAAPTTTAQCMAMGFGENILLHFTGTYLTGISPTPSPITVSAGQTVLVTVQFGFE